MTLLAWALVENGSELRALVGETDDVACVSLYQPDGGPIFLQVPVPS